MDTTTPAKEGPKRARRRSSAVSRSSEMEEVTSPSKVKDLNAKTSHYNAVAQGAEAHEDPYGDDFESEDQWEDASGDDESDDCDDETSPTGTIDTTADTPTSTKKLSKKVGFLQGDTKVFRPGVDSLQDGEKLDYDPSAYEMLHRFTLEWPALSFDIVPDNLGVVRRTYPHTMFVVAGTQGEASPAGPATGNKVFLMKWSRMMRTNKDGQELSDEDESSDEEDEDETDEDAVEESVQFHHPGAVNRIRVCPQEADHVGTVAPDRRSGVRCGVRGRLDFNLGPIRRARRRGRKPETKSRRP
eukprot:Selendium_serpulae@DN5999_c1_g2_i1.p1